ncbi:hypothetical protein J6590_087025 [Homalodisca vitripennis]|nr:hypothetical protein J6590_087025 [Homalodisca vitripennis]
MQTSSTTEVQSIQHGRGLTTEVTRTTFSTDSSLSYLRKFAQQFKVPAPQRIRIYNMGAVQLLQSLVQSLLRDLGQSDILHYEFWAFIPSEDCSTVQTSSTIEVQSIQHGGGSTTAVSRTYSTTSSGLSYLRKIAEQCKLAAPQRCRVYNMVAAQLLQSVGHTPLRVLDFHTFGKLLNSAN